jgi:predicted DNA-binding transcriptional regulator YafY
MDPVGPVVDASLLATLASACRDQLRLAFTYGDSRGRSAERSVEPQGLAHTGHRWYLVAWDRVREDWRTFRIDRIVGAPTVGAHFAPRVSPDGGDLKAYVSRSLAVAPYAEQARIVLHAPLSEAVHRIPASVGVLKALDAQRCVLECGAHSLDTLVYWLVVLDLDFEVLAPQALKDRLKAIGERALRCAP